MSDAQLISLIGVLFALLVALVGVIFNGLRERIKSRLDASTLEIAKLEARFEQRSKERNEIDYAFRHTQYVNDINSINVRLWPLGQKVEDIEKRLDSLHEWKHVVGEAYLPRAVDDIERRVGKLETKVFNGQLPRNER